MFTRLSGGSNAASSRRPIGSKPRGFATLSVDTGAALDTKRRPTPYWILTRSISPSFSSGFIIRERSLVKEPRNLAAFGQLCVQNDKTHDRALAVPKKISALASARGAVV